LLHLKCVERIRDSRISFCRSWSAVHGQGNFFGIKTTLEHVSFQSVLQPVFIHEVRRDADYQREGDKAATREERQAGEIAGIYRCEPLPKCWGGRKGIHFSNF
jgi:hypothetical protein